MAAIILIWTLYYANQLSMVKQIAETSHKEGRPAKQESIKSIDLNFTGISCKLVDSIAYSGDEKKGIDSIQTKIDSINNQFTRLIYTTGCNSDLMKALDSTYYAEVGCCADTSIYFTERKFDELKYALQSKMAKESKTAKTSWANWLRIVQFKGLLLFAVLILFLVTVWYHAYTARLAQTKVPEEKENKEGKEDTKDAKEESFSEINISRISIYFIFLLIIPFFKPIDEKDVNFDKPFISGGNPFNWIDDRDSFTGKTQIIETTVPVPDQRFLDEFNKVKSDVTEIKNGQVRLKKEPAKNEKPYDTKPTH